MNPPASEAVKELFHCLSSVWWRLDNLYYIQDEDGNKVRFKLRPLQKLFLLSAWFRNIILKARQLGFTTAIDIFILDRAIFNPNQQCGIIAHTKDDVVEIFEKKIRYAYINLPSDIRAMVTADTDRANQLKFSNGSQIRVAVSMRSGTLQVLHISEYGKLWAWYPKKAAEVKTGSLPTVHKDGMIFIESTAEGVGGHFHELSVEAQELQETGRKLGRLDYKFHFFPWYDDDKYEEPPPSGFEFSELHKKYFDSLEKAINRKLSVRKRYWYVVTERTYKQEMKQEYPSTPTEAFLFSGRKAFDPDDLHEADGMCYPPDFIGEISVVNGALMARPDGEFLIWDMPDPNEQYAIGADVAEGLEHGDYSSFDVLDSWGQQVAHWHGHIDTDLFGQVISQVGKLYNFAYVGVERNNHGHAVINKLNDLMYPNMHIQTQLDDKNDKRTRKYGWHTNQASKPFIIDNLKALLRDREAGIRHKATVAEAHTYIVDNRGRFNAQEKCFDDRIMSYAISQEMVRVMPRRSATANTNIERTESNADWRAS